MTPEEIAEKHVSHDCDCEYEAEVEALAADIRAYGGERVRAAHEKEHGND